MFWLIKNMVTMKDMVPLSHTKVHCILCPHLLSFSFLLARTAAETTNIWNENYRITRKVSIVRQILDVQTYWLIQLDYFSLYASNSSFAHSALALKISPEGNGSLSSSFCVCFLRLGKYLGGLWKHSILNLRTIAFPRQWPAIIAGNDLSIILNRRMIHDAYAMLSFVDPLGPLQLWNPESATETSPEESANPLCFQRRMLLWRLRRERESCHCHGLLPNLLPLDAFRMPCAKEIGSIVSSPAIVSDLLSRERPLKASLNIIPLPSPKYSKITNFCETIWGYPNGLGNTWKHTSLSSSSTETNRWRLAGISHPPKESCWLLWQKTRIFKGIQKIISDM